MLRRKGRCGFVHATPQTKKEGLKPSFADVDRSRDSPGDTRPSPRATTNLFDATLYPRKAPGEACKVMAAASRAAASPPTA
jgi:hypothetical protein